MAYNHPLTPFLAHKGANLAPSEPILKLREDKKLQPSPLQKAVQKLYQDKMKFEKAAFDERISMGHLVALFIQGNHLVKPRLYGPGFYTVPIKDQAMREQAMNLTGFYAQACLTKWINSNPNALIKAGVDSAQSIAAAQNARPMVDYWESQWYTAKFNIREGLRAMQDGWYGSRIIWDPMAEGPSAQKVNVEDYEVEDPGQGACYDCMYAGMGKDFEPENEFDSDKCPNCGSRAVVVQRSQVHQMHRIVPGEKKQYGAPKIIPFPFAAARFDLAKDMEDSSWAIIRQKVMPGVFKMLLGDAVLPDTESSDDKSLDVIDALAYSGQAFDGASRKDWIGRTYDRRPTVAEFWVSPEDLAEIETEPYKSVDGIEVPGGKLSNTFKEPVCFVGWNDMSLITGIHYEKHCDQIVTGQWFMESESGGGRGMQDTVAVQKRHNKYDGLIDQGISALAVPSVFTDKKLLTEDQGQYLFTPRTNIWMDLQQLPAGVRLQDAIYVGKPGDISGQAINYGQVFLRQMFQLSSLVVEFTEGILPIDNRTATGAQITAHLANSLFGPMLSLKAGVRLRIAEILVMLHTRHCPVPRYFPGKDGKPGQSVSGSSLKGTLVYELAQGSQMPVTPFTQQSEVRAVIEAFQGVEGLLMMYQQMPSMFSALTRPFNVKFEPQDQDTISTLCLDRLEQMKSNLNAGVRDPNVLVEQIIPPIALEEPKHDDKKRWWQDWLDTKEGQSSPFILRQAASMMFWKHENFKTQLTMPQQANQGLVAGIGQAAAAAPMAMGQQALMPPEQQDNSAQIQAEQKSREAGLGALEESAWIEHEDRKHEREMQNRLDVARVQGENQVKVARARPKPSAKGKAA